MHPNRVLCWLSVGAIAISAFPPMTNAWQESGDRTITVVILDEDGQPLERVNVRANIWSRSPVLAPDRTQVTDETGRVDIELPGDMYILRLWIWADGYTRLFAGWEESEIKAGDVPPDEYTFRMIRGSTISGVIQNEDGEPIAGAKVGIAATAAHPEGDRRLRFGHWYAEADDNSLLVTNEQGRWSLDTLPPAEDLQVQVTLSHEDYIDDTRGELQRAQSVTTQQLRDGTATIVMQKGIAISGELTNEAGEPVTNGLVVWGDQPYREPGTNEVRIGLDGSYELPPMPPGNVRV
ncbi:MAG: carboxypeptidase-like regulatory domain-containing protein, partial [Pirellulaceae bacterium]